MASPKSRKFDSSVKHKRPRTSQSGETWWSKKRQSSAFFLHMQYYFFTLHRRYFSPGFFLFPDNFGTDESISGHEIPRVKTKEKYMLNIESELIYRPDRHNAIQDSTRLDVGGRSLVDSLWQPLYAQITDGSLTGAQALQKGKSAVGQLQSEFGFTAQEWAPLKQLAFKSLEGKTKHLQNEKYVEELKSTNSPWLGVLEALHEAVYKDKSAKFFHNFAVPIVVDLKSRLQQQTQKLTHNQTEAEKLYQASEQNMTSGITEFLNVHLSSRTEEETTALRKQGLRTIIDTALAWKYGNQEEFYQQSKLLAEQDEIPTQVQAGDVFSPQYRESEAARLEIKPAVANAMFIGMLVYFGLLGESQVKTPNTLETQNDKAKPVTIYSRVLGEASIPAPVETPRPRPTPARTNPTRKLVNPLLNAESQRPNVEASKRLPFHLRELNLTSDFKISSSDLTGLLGKLFPLQESVDPIPVNTRLTDEMRQNFNWQTNPNGALIYETDQPGSYVVNGHSFLGRNGKLPMEWVRIVVNESLKDPGWSDGKRLIIKQYDKGRWRQFELRITKVLKMPTNQFNSAISYYSEEADVPKHRKNRDFVRTDQFGLPEGVWKRGTIAFVACDGNYIEGLEGYDQRAIVLTEIVKVSELNGKNR